MEQVPEASPTVAPSSAEAAALAMPDNINEALAQIAREQGVQVDGVGVVTKAAPPQVAQPQPQAEQQVQEQPAPEAQKVEIPDKFKNPDGTVNVEKVQKSTASAEEMVAKFLALEKEAQRAQNRVNNPPPTPQQQLTPLEVQVAQDLLNEAAALGKPMEQAHAIAQARILTKLVEAKHNADMSATETLRQKMEDNERSRELQGLIQDDAWLLTDDARATLWKIRQENPWINQAPKPWEAAYQLHRGRTGHAPQVQTPTPQGPTAKAPPTPVGPVTRVQKTIDPNDKRALNEMPMKDLEALAKSLIPGLRLNR